MMRLVMVLATLWAGLALGHGMDGTKVAPSSFGQEKLLSNVKQLTLAGKRAGESYFSHDDQWMVFQSERDKKNPFYQIYLMDLKKGKVRRVSPGYGKTTCAWISPNKKEVLFASTHLDPQAKKKQKDELERRRRGNNRRYSWDFDEHYDIFVATPRGKKLKNLTKVKGYDAEGSWSPNGRLIAFGSNRIGYTGELSAKDQKVFNKDPSYGMEIYIMNADGTGLKRLTKTMGYDGGPFFSPDGKRIVWRRFAPDGKTAEVWTMNIDGSDQKQITKLKKMSWAPYYHPSGDYIIFATNVHGHRNFELYMVDKDGKKDPVRVTYTDGFDGLPVFLPASDRIAWTTSRGAGKGAQVFIGDWNDHGARKLLGLPVKQPKFDDTHRAIRAIDAKKHVNYLASDALGGRLTGTNGEKLATKYVADFFKHLKLESFDKNSFYDSFNFVSGVKLGVKNKLALNINGTANELALKSEYLPLSFASNGSFKKAEVVFAGYGIQAPKSDKFSAYNSYFHLDVKNKWVMIFRFLPENIDKNYRQYLHRFSSLRRKAMIARDLGAKGLIIVSGPNSGVSDEIIRLKMDSSSADAGIMAISVSDKVATKFLAPSKKTLKGLQDKLDKGQSVSGFKLGNVSVSGSVEIKKETKQSRNVVGVLRSKRKNAGFLLLGAHIDHLGTKVKKDGTKLIYNGADDNASGVAGMLEIAQYLAAKKKHLKWNIIFAAWSGEELGLLGSAAFVKKLQGKRKDIYPKLGAAFNLDMIGRLDKQLIIQAAGSSDYWGQIIERLQLKSKLSIKVQLDPYLPTDSMSFYLAGVPTLNGFTGAHADYHKPTDTAEKIDYIGIEETSKLFAKIIFATARRGKAPRYIKMENPNQGGTRFRVYLGTIPDYTNTEVKGVLLTGVKPKSPAAKAGLKSGDIITKLAGFKIANIYDFTYALAALKVGVTVDIEVKRNNKILKLKITPISRV